LAVVCLACEACSTPWTARVCTSNADGNCKAIDNGQPHQYPVKSANIVHLVNGLTDVAVREPACADNGIGEVDVNVVDRDDLSVTIYCLVDKPSGTMKLTPAPSSSAPSAPALVPAPAH
jgi:hypothetical protein